MSARDQPRRYRDTRRRLLVDMHIPDWDERFLARYDPRDLVEGAAGAGAEGVMLYFQSHLGLCYYPTQVGRQHGAAAGRDWAGEALTAFRERDIPVCAYYSVNFNNEAWLGHPDWRLQPASPSTIGVLPRERYGIVCLNNLDYRAFVDAQIDEIAAYPVDSFFFDMVWWNGVCICPACHNRYRDECGSQIPDKVDWDASIWTDFQAARERWLADFAVSLRARARRHRPEIEVYHNFALGLSNWTRGVSFSSVAGHDFLGGDFYGGRAEQLLITRLMLNLTPKRPAEFMTTVSAGLTEHCRLRPPGQMITKALASLTADAAFLAIVAINPDGTLDGEAMERTRLAFGAAAQFDSFVGGTAVEDVALYCSDNSKANFWVASQAIDKAPASSIPDYPHFHALAGAARALQESHIPFGVATRANLAELSRWPVLVLANAERMADEEIDAFREYVRNGGQLYASRGSSLWAMDGARQDFALADLFGCHFEGAETGRLVYAQVVASPGLSRPIAHWLDSSGNTGCLRVQANGCEMIAMLTLPYGHPEPGSVSDRHWSSIHSSPPWTATDRPLIVRNAFGAGRVIYSAFDVEAGDSPEHRRLFVSLILELLGQQRRIDAETHPQVWLSAFDQESRLVLMLLNYPAEEPALPVPSAHLAVCLPERRRCAAVRSYPSGQEHDHRIDDHGRVLVEIGRFERFLVLTIEHEAVSA